MPFRVNARTLLQLGAELISSDAIAFYELIKNAFDAASKRVEIRVVVRIPYEAQVRLRTVVATERKKEEEPTAAPAPLVAEIVRNTISADVDTGVRGGKSLLDVLRGAQSWADLENTIEEANYIEIEDTGEGMSLEDLGTTYLTVGTRSRLAQRERQQERARVDSGGSGGPSPRPILGEKGVGRLSAMRLGRRVRVTSSKEGEGRWNELDIDWSIFSHDSDILLDQIAVAPRYGAVKRDPNVSGTTIHIAGLESVWTQDKLREIATLEFSKLTDPFTPKARYPITLRYNGDVVPIPRFDRILFDQAHAVVDAEFSCIGEELRLDGVVNYRLRTREKTFILQGTHLTSATNATPATLRSLGPFRLKLYWFNRSLLRSIPEIGDQKQVRALVARWSGGLMVYRDGFRVNPYGGPEDDWLNLDKAALAASGYKVSRQQIIGKVDVSSLDNPRLVDQTNREGLRDCDEKQALIALSRYVLLTEFRGFLNAVDEEVQAREPVSFDDIEERVEKQGAQAQQTLAALFQKHPEITQDSGVATGLREAIDGVHALLIQAKDLVVSYEKGRTEMVNLAGLGLIVEIVAHELSRATTNTLAALADRNDGDLPQDVRSLFDTLQYQFKALQRRLTLLDPLSTTSRLRKETFDLVAWVDEILQSHDAQFRRHRIALHFGVTPQGSTIKVTAVKGMIVQIIENLVNNSVYWLGQQQILDKLFQARIDVTIDASRKEIRVADNGPGIDRMRREEIFQPFVTTKPPGEGKGLGLYISREIAHYNGASLYLWDEPTVHKDTLNTFILLVEGERQ